MSHPNPTHDETNVLPEDDLVDYPSADDEREAIIVNLTYAQEEILKEAHAMNYHGTDDNMPDAYEMWLEKLPLSRYKELLNIK